MSVEHKSIINDDRKEVPLSLERDIRILLNQAGIAIPSNKHIGLYFTASWCRPCKMFTPKLMAVASKVPLTVVSISCDLDSKPYQKFCADNPEILSIPYAHPVETRLKQIYAVQQLPTLIVLDPEGYLMTENGSEAVLYNGPSKFPWSVSRCRRLSDSVISDINQKPCLVLLAEKETIDEETKDEYTEALKRVAYRINSKMGEQTENLRQLQIFYAFQNNRLAGKLRSYAGLPRAVANNEEEEEECPVLMLINLRKGLKFKADPAEALSKEIWIQRFVDSYAMGQLAPFYGTYGMEEESESPGVTIVTAKALEELLDSDRIVFVLAYAPWCLESVQFVQELHKVGRILVDIPGALDYICLAEFNIDSGEVDRTIFRERVLPIAKIFTPERLLLELEGTEGVLFKKRPSPLRILEFLRDETKKTIFDVDFGEAIHRIPTIE